MSVLPSDDSFDADAIARQFGTKPKTASPYDEHITGAAAQYELDPDLIRAMMHEESRGKPGARSPKGASGLMQLMPATARNLGVKNIFDPKENIYGGAKYARQLLDMFNGDVDLALAGYNAGEGAVAKYGNKIPPYKETRNYVKNIRGRYTGGGYAANRGAAQPDSFDPDAIALSFANSSNQAFDPDAIAKSFVPTSQPTYPTFLAENGLPDTPDSQALFGGQPTPVNDSPVISMDNGGEIAQPYTPESPATIATQADAAARPDNSRAMVLLAPGQVPNIDDPIWQGFGAFNVPGDKDMPDRLGMVNLDMAKKLKLRTPDEIQEYINKNPKALTTLMGKTVDVGNATGGNQPTVVTTLMKNGVPVEATSTVVTDPTQIPIEAAEQKKQFPDGQTQLMGTDDVVAARMAEEPIDFTQPEATYQARTDIPLPDMSQVVNQPLGLKNVKPLVPKQAKQPTTQVGQKVARSTSAPTNDKAFNEVNATLQANGMQPISREQFDANMAKLDASVDVKVETDTLTANGDKLSDLQVTEQVKGGEGYVPTKEVGKPGGNGLAYSFTPNDTSKDSLREAYNAAAKANGVEASYDVYAKTPSGQRDIAKYQKGDRIEIYQDALIKGGADPAYFRMQEAQNRVETPLKNNISEGQLSDKPTLTPEEQTQAENIGGWLKKKGWMNPVATTITSNVIGGFLEEGAKLNAGISRLGMTNPIIAAAQLFGGADEKSFDKFAEQARVVGQTAKGDGVILDFTADAANVVGKTPYFLALVEAPAVLGAGKVLSSIVGFAAQSAITNTDKPIPEQMKGIATSAALGAAFGVTSRFANWAATKAANKYFSPEIATALGDTKDEALSAIREKGLKIQELVTKGATQGEREAATKALDKFLTRYGMTAESLTAADLVDNAALDKAIRKNAVVNTLINGGIRLGIVPPIGYAVTKLEGGSDYDARKSALLFAAMELLATSFGKKKGERFTSEEMDKANGSLIRIPDNTGKPKDVVITKEGNDLVVTEVKDAPTEGVQAQGLPKESPLTKGITDAVKDEAANLEKPKVDEPVEAPVEKAVEKPTPKSDDAPAPEPRPPITKIAKYDTPTSKPGAFEFGKAAANDDVVASTTVSGEDVYKEIAKLPNTTEAPANDQMDAANVKGKTFERKAVKIADLIKNDQDLRDFVEKTEIKPGRKIEAPIILGKVTRGAAERDGVIDGMHRIAQAVANGEKTIDAYVETVAPKTAKPDAVTDAVGSGKEPWQMTGDEFKQRFPTPKIGQTYISATGQPIKITSKVKADGLAGLWRIKIGNKMSTVLTQDLRRLVYGDLASREFATHSAYIKKALADGKPVPADVLADYPDLRAAESATEQVSAPVGKPISDAYYITQTKGHGKQATDTFIKVDGKPVSIKGAEALDLFVHPTNENKKLFVVSEGKTGMRIGKPETSAKKAIQNAESWLNYDGVDKYIGYRESSGIATPRYKSESAPLAPNDAVTYRGKPATIKHVKGTMAILNGKAQAVKVSELERVDKDEVAFAKPDDEKNLITVHNLSEGALQFADKMGGLAMPSVAVTKPSVGFDGFGGISLIADKSLIDPKRSGNKVVDADMYSPRYPPVDYKIAEKPFETYWNNVTKPFVEKYGEPESGTSKAYYRKPYAMHDTLQDSGVRELENNDYFKAYYLKSIDETLPDTEKELREIFYDNDKAKALAEFAQQEFEPLVEKMQFYNGTDYNGRKKFKEFTLDNVVRKMKSEMKAGENFHYGAGTLRSKAASKFRSIKQIQSARDKIVKSDDLAAKKDEMNDKLITLAEQYAPFYEYDKSSFGYTDRFVDAISEGLQTHNLRKALDEWGFKNVDDFKPITDYLDELTSLPTEYFEAKPQRAVGLGEFKAAVVPSDISAKTRQILKQNGLDIIEYGDGKSRKDAIQEAGKKHEVMFRTPDELADPDVIESLENIKTYPDEVLMQDPESVAMVNAGDGVLRIDQIKAYEMLRRLMGQYVGGDVAKALPDTSAVKEVRKGDIVKITPENATNYVDYIKKGGKMSPQSLIDLSQALKERWNIEKELPFAAFRHDGTGLKHDGSPIKPEEFAIAQAASKNAFDKWRADAHIVSSQPNARGLAGDMSSPIAYHFSTARNVEDILAENHIYGDMGETYGVSTTTNASFDHPDITQTRNYGVGNKPETFADLGVRIDLDLSALQADGIKVRQGNEDYGTFVGEEELRIGGGKGIQNASKYIQQIQIDPKIVQGKDRSDLEKAASANGIPVVEKTNYTRPVEILYHITDGAFDGAHLTPQQVKEFTKVINDIAGRAEAAGIDPANLNTIVKLINDTADERGLILLWNDAALAEEKTHRVIAEVRTNARATQVSPKIRDKILNSDVFKNALKGRFGRGYGKANKATQVEEFAVKAALGQFDEIGVTDKTKREAVGLSVDFFESIIDNAEKGKFTRDEIINKFAAEIAYATETRQEQESRQANTGNEESVSESDASVERQEPDAGREDRQGAGDARGVEKSAKQKVAAFSRILGEQYLYDPQGHEETERRATTLLGNIGTQEAAYQVLNSAKPSAEAMRIVYWELERLTGVVDGLLSAGKQVEAEAAAQELANLTSSIIQRQISTGQEVEIAKVLPPMSSEAALLTASRLKQYTNPEATLTPAETKNIAVEADARRTAEAKFQEAQRKYINAQAKIRRLEADKPVKERAGPTSVLLKKYTAKEPQILADLQKLFPESSLFKGDGVAFSKPDNSQTQTEAFKKWFGDSKVVDENDDPLVVYHGTRTDFDTFDTNASPDKQKAFYFTRDPRYAAMRAGTLGMQRGSVFWENEVIQKPGVNVMPVFLSIQNPRTVQFGPRDRFSDPEIERSRIFDIKSAKKYDGAIFEKVDGDGTIIDRYYVAFNPTQIKSAIGNRGTFDATNPDITFSRPDTGLDPAKLEAARDFTVMQILRGNGYEPVMGLLRDLGLSETEAKDVHLAAMEVISPSEEMRLKDKTDEQKAEYKEARAKVAEKLKIRREHRNAAKKHAESEETKDTQDKALNLYKKRLEKQIKSMDEQIKTGVKADGRTELELDTEAETLKKKRDALKATYDETFGVAAKKPLSDEQRLERAKKALERSIEALKSGKEKQTSKIADTDEIKALREILQGLRAKRLSGIARLAKEQGLSKELVFAIDRLTNGKINTENSVLGDIRKEFDLDVPKSIELARKAKNEIARIKAERRAEIDKEKGISAEARIAMNEARREKAAATLKLSKLFKQMSTNPTLIKRFNNDFRAKVVNNWGTQIFNAVQGGVNNVAETVFLDGIETALRGLGVNIGQDNMTERQFKDLFLPVAYMFGNQKQIAEQALSEFPEEYIRVHTGLFGDIDLTQRKIAEGKTGVSWLAHSYFDQMDRLNNVMSTISGAKLQELHFRSAVVSGVLDQIVRAKSKGKETLKSATENRTLTKYVTETDAKNAVDKALKVTFASEIDTRIGKALKKGYDQLDNVLPVILNPVTFARFTYTTTRNMVANPLLFGALDTKNYSTRNFAQGVMAWGGVAIAAGLMSAFGGDDDKWDTLTVDGKTFSIKRFFPLSAYFYVAHLIKSTSEGRPLPGYKDLLEGFASLETDYFNYGAPMEFAFEAVPKAYREGSLDPLGGSSARLLASYFAGQMRFFKPMKDALASVDKEEATMRDWDDSAQQKALSELSKSIPGIVRFGKPKIDPITDKPIEQVAPLAKFLGLNFVHPSFMNPKDSVATEWANRLFEMSFKGGKQTAEEREASFIRKRIKNEIRAGRLAPADVESKITEFVEAGKLSEAQGKRLKTDIKLSELQEKLKYNFTTTDKGDLERLRKVWGKATDEEKNDIREVLQTKQNRNEEFDTEFGLQYKVGGKSSKKPNTIQPPANVQSAFTEHGIKPPDVGEYLTPVRGGPRVKLSPEQYEKYKNETLTRIYTEVDKVIATPQYQKETDETKRFKMIDKAIRKQRAVESKETKQELTPRKLADLGTISAHSDTTPTKYGAKLMSARQSDNVIDLREGSTLYPIMKAVNAGDYDRAERLAKRIDTSKLTVAEREELTKFRTKAEAYNVPDNWLTLKRRVR